MPPKYITPQQLGQNVDNSSSNEIDKGIKSLDQISTIIDKAVTLMDKIQGLKKISPDTSSNIESKSNSQAVQKFNQMKQAEQKPEIIYREPKIAYDKMAKKLIEIIEELVKRDEKKTVKEYLETEVKKLDEKNVLSTIIQEWMKEFIEND